jgi:Uncharacterised protein family (UPF0236)
MICPRCHGDADCKGFRTRNLVCLLGSISFSRHYYHCPSCHQGLAPLDETLGLRAHDRTPAADELVCLAGVQDSFAKAAAVLPRLAGLRLSESTIERATEEAGLRLAEAQNAGQTLGPVLPWSWHKDAEGKTVGYVALDATGIGQQGPGGALAEGRMVYVGMIYNPVPKERDRWANPEARRPECQARYVAGLQPLGEMAVPLRRQGAQVGMDQAERWVALSDGGSGLEDFLRVNFGRVDAVILDFWHAAEYLGTLAKALYPGQEERSTAWCQEWCSRLKAEGGAAVVAALQELKSVHRGKGFQTALAEVVRYFSNQVGRMDYPTYVQKGWQIGSGAVESACKTVIGQRQKGGGMRWGLEGGNGVAHLRALYRSERGQWAAFWTKN